MTYRLPTSLVAALVAVLIAAPASAQDQDPDDVLAPPHFSVVEGAADLNREGSVVPADAGQILAAGDRVTTRNGRVEILFGDGSAVHLDQGTTLDLLDEDLMRLVEGRAYLHVAPSDPPFEYRIDTPGGSIRTAVAGEYRIIAGPVSELAVARGVASILTTGGEQAVRSGEAIQMRAGQAAGYVMPFNAAAWDPFDRWSQDLRRPRVTAITSAPLNGPLTSYNATLTRYGTWSHDVEYGDVWYPHVQAGWRPFYNGRWATIAPYGWTWAGVDPWAWPTHYYGNWRITPAGAWFWIPGVRWRPAAVHWTVTTAHIGWAPWGFSSFNFGFTVLPRSVFHANVIVPRHALRLTHSALRPVVVAARPPLPRGLVVPRAFGSPRRASVFASRGDARVDDRGPRVAQPRNPGAALGGRGNDGVRASRPETPRAITGDRDNDRRAGVRSNGGAPSSGLTQFRMPPRRETGNGAGNAGQQESRSPVRRAEPRGDSRGDGGSPREQPGLRSNGGAPSSGLTQFRMPPRRETGNDAGNAGGQESRSPVRSAEPRPDSRGDGGPARAPRAAPRESPRDTGRGGERRAAPRRNPN